MANYVKRISVAVVDTLAEGDEVRDVQLKGFGCRRQKSGGVVYFVHRRIKGKLVRITIGAHGSPWTPETARKEAGNLIAKMTGGQDPRIERKQKVVEGVLFKDAADEFIKAYIPKLKPKSQTAYKDAIRLRLKPALGNKRLLELTSKDVEKAHTGWKKAPRAANIALTVLSRIMTWNKVTPNPCTGVKRYHERKVERYLSSAETTRMAAEIRKLEDEGGLTVFAAAALKLLVYTGARTSEILNLTWKMVDVERGLLLLPDSKTHEKPVVLNSAAMDVLENLPRLEGNPYVIVGHVNGKALSGLKKQWKKVRKAAGIVDVRVHDLRHSFGSVAASAGGSLPIIGKAMGHADPKTTARYAHLGENPVRELVEMTGARFQELMGKEKPLGEKGEVKLRRVVPRKKGKAVEPGAA